MHDVILNKLVELGAVKSELIEKIKTDLLKDKVFFDFFSDGLSTNLGEAMESLATRIFVDLEDKREQTTDYDKIFEKNDILKKVEIKSTRVLRKDIEGSDFLRSCSLDQWLNPKKHKILKFSSIKFQQVKPRCFDYMLGFVVCNDNLRVYLVPSDDINPTTDFIHKNKIRLQVQHKDNPLEGQLSINKALEKYIIFDYNKNNLNDKFCILDFINGI